MIGLMIGCLAGCSGPRVVDGEVRFSDGTPLEVGQVIFESAELRVGSACELNPDGTFRLLEPLPAGEYAVYITDARKAINAAAGIFGPVLIAEKYTDPVQTPLRAKVGSGPIVITVEPARKSG